LPNAQLVTEAWDEVEFRTDRADVAAISSSGHPNGASGDAAASARRAVVVSLADWDDRAKKNGLEPHSPEVTELVIDLEVDLPH
jgi:hypothetical protein